MPAHLLKRSDVNRRSHIPLFVLCLTIALLWLPVFLSRADDTHPPVPPDSGDTAAPDSGTPVIPLPPPNPPPPVEQENGKPLFGVFTGNSVDGVKQYEQWFGRPTDGILGYTGQANWPDYEGSLGWAMNTVWKHIDRRVLWSVSLIPVDETLAEAAKGTYNEHWRRIAKKLAAWHPEEKVIYVRTGWEFNAGWMTYRAVGQPQNFIGAWRQFVSVFRSVSPRFRFDWCPAGGDWMPMKAEAAYPGDDYVDIIGLDIYDNEKYCKIKDPKERWDKIYLHGNDGLLWHQQFAQAHHKPMSYPEWGVGGCDSGDDPYFVEQMHKWFMDNHVIYATFWNSNSSYHGLLSDGTNPNAGAKYKELFGTPDSANPAPVSNPPIAAPDAPAGGAPPPVPAAALGSSPGNATNTAAANGANP
jgi:hypothetical protein